MNSWEIRWSEGTAGDSLLVVTSLGARFLRGTAGGDVVALLVSLREAWVKLAEQAAGRPVLSKSLRVANVKPDGQVKLHGDHTLSREGKPIFPLLMYHAMPEHFEEMAELGINIVLNDFCLNRANPGDRVGYARDLAQTLDAASNLAAQARMIALAGGIGRVVPGHDPAVFSRFPIVKPGLVRID